MGGLLALCFLQVEPSIAQSSDSVPKLDLKYREAVDKIEKLQAALEKAQQENQNLKRQIETLRVSQSSAPVSQKVTQAESDYEQVIDTLTREITAHPDTAAAYVKRGVAQMKLKRYSKAIQDFDAAVARGFQKAIIYNQRGLAQFQLGHLQKAIRDFTQAIKRNPNLAEAYNNRGIAQRTLGNYAQAMRDLREADRLGLKQVASQMQVLRDEVQRTQQQLQRAGFQPGPADGLVGSQTLAALRAYQERHGLPVTGQLDARTKQHLNMKSAAVPASPQPESDLLSHFVHRPDPEYPLIARQHGMEGVVTLRFELLGNGTIGQVEVVKSSGHSVLDESAKQGVKRWSHNWVTQDHTGKSHWRTLTFTFALDKEGQQ